MPTPRRDARYDRRRRELVKRLASSSSPVERMNAAWAYFRAMLADAPPDRTAAAAATVTDQLLTHADHLTEGTSR
jgi:hypothetical protein